MFTNKAKECNLMLYFIKKKKKEMKNISVSYFRGPRTLQPGLLLCAFLYSIFLLFVYISHVFFIYFCYLTIYILYLHSWCGAQFCCACTMTIKDCYILFCSSSFYTDLIFSIWHPASISGFNLFVLFIQFNLLLYSTTVHPSWVVDKDIIFPFLQVAILLRDKT